MAGYLLSDNPGVLVPPEDGWYDTGDVVDVDDEGYITIKGRLKRFAKVGGEMISLGRGGKSHLNLMAGIYACRGQYPR